VRRITAAFVLGILAGAVLLGGAGEKRGRSSFFSSREKGVGSLFRPSGRCDGEAAARSERGEKDSRPLFRERPCAGDDSPIDDSGTLKKFTAGLSALMKQNKTVKMSALIAQLKRTKHRLVLPAASKASLKAPVLYKRCRPSVLLVGSLYKCSKCSKWHTSAAGGFAIAPKGIIVTNYHVVNNATRSTMGAMTLDGKVYAVREVLAADKHSDVAILRLDGANPPPLTLRADAPVGTGVYVISHPDKKLYTLTEGMLSRRFLRLVHGRKIPALSITADYAKGSSGAPVMDAAGAVIGMVATTHSVYYKREKGVDKNLQMVIRNCVPARAILNCLSK